jgi:mannose-6-phosphate isomerase-like protein (cupin superfamily)
MKTTILLLIFSTIVIAGSTTRPVVVNSNEVAIRTNDNATARVQMLLPKDVTGDPRFYFGRGEFQPGASVAEHVHEKSAEIVYIIQGTGQFTVAGKAYDIHRGTAIYIPENTPHSFLNNGKEVVEVVQMYSPAGPEDRFLQWKNQN